MSADAYYSGAKTFYYLAGNHYAIKELSETSLLEVTIVTEAGILLNFIQDISPNDILPSVLCSRIEYFLMVIHNVLQNRLNPGNQITETLFELWREIKNRSLNAYDNDDTSLSSNNIATCSNTNINDTLNPSCTVNIATDTTGMAPSRSRTNWTDMCITSLSVALVQLLKQNLSLRSNIEVGMAESIALAQSPLWQVQYVAINLIHTLLLYESWCDTEAVVNTNNTIASGSVNAELPVSTSRKTRPGRSPSPSGQSDNASDSPVLKSSRSNKNNLRKNSSFSSLVADKSSKTSKATPTINNRKGESGKMSTSQSSMEINNMVRVSNSADGSGYSEGKEAVNPFPAASSPSSRSSRLGATRPGGPPMPLRKSLSHLGHGGVMRVLRCVDEICKSGYLRSLVWLLVHSHEMIRKAAAEVLHMILSHLETPTSTRSRESFRHGSNSTSTNMGIVSDLWACCVEQGLVPHLEYIRQGMLLPQSTLSESSKPRVTTYQVPTLSFPEVSIRQLAEILLGRVAQEVASQPAVLSRLQGALVHSGSTKLRVNILSGLLYLHGRLPSIGSLLCTLVSAERSEKPPPSSSALSSSSTKGIAQSFSSTSNSTKPPTSATTDLDSSTPRRTAFYEMLTTTIRDAGEFCHLLDIVRHFLEAALQYQECELHLVKTNLGNEIATQTDQNSGVVLRPSGSSKSLLGTSLEPMVLIKDRDRTTKMVCPPLAVIEEHSPVLYPLLKEAMDHQIATALQKLHSSGGGDAAMASIGIEQKLQGLLKNMEEVYFVTLLGSYNIWQEVFSHMTDAYLLESSVGNMSTLGLIEALQLTRQFGMRELGKQYARALVQRLAVENFIQIFQASVGIYTPTKPAPRSGVTVIEIEDAPLHLHLHLIIHCMKYLETYYEKIVTIWKPKDTIIVVDAVHRVLLCLFLIQE